MSKEKRIVSFSLGHRYNLPDISWKEECFESVPIEVVQMVYKPDNLVFNNGQIKINSQVFYYGKIDSKSKVKHRIHFCQLNNRTDLQ
jgi:hypothetical protein